MREINWTDISTWGTEEWLMVGLLALLALIVLRMIFVLMIRVLYGELKDQYVNFILGAGEKRKLKSFKPYGLFTRNKLRRKLDNGKWVVLSERDLSLLKLAKFDTKNVKLYGDLDNSKISQPLPRFSTKEIFKFTKTELQNELDRLQIFYDPKSARWVLISMLSKYGTISNPKDKKN